MNAAAVCRLLTPAPARTALGPAQAAGHRGVVVGYGPVGRTVSRLLRSNEIEPAVVEMNLETVRRLREEGLEAVYGDAARRDALEEAGIGGAGGLLLTASGLRDAAEIIRLARELNPGGRVLVRCSYLRMQAAFRRAGADEVFSGEGEVALAITEVVLRRLGATPEQIERERDRVRDDLFGGPTTPDKVRPLEGRSAGDPARPAPPGLGQAVTGEVRDGSRRGAVGVERRGPPAEET